MESKEIQSTLQKYLMRESQNKLQIKDKREEKSKMDNHQQSLQSKLDASKAKADKKNVVEPPKVTGNWSKNVDHIKDSNNEPSIEEKLKNIQSRLNASKAKADKKPVVEPPKVTANWSKNVDHIKDSNNEPSIEEKLKNIQSRLNASKAKADEKPVVEPPKVTGNWSKNVNHIKDPLGHMDKVTKMEEEVDERIRLQMKAHRQKIELVAKSLEDKVPLETADEKEKMSLKLEKDKEMIREIYRMETSKLVDAMKNQHVQSKSTHQITENGIKKINEVKVHNQQLSFDDELKSTPSKLDAYYAERDVIPVAEPAKPISASSNPLGHMDKVMKMEEEVDERIRLQMKAHRQKIEQFAKSLEDKVPLETADEKEKTRLKLEKDKEMIREIYRMETSKLVDAMKNQHVQQLETFRKKTQENLAEIKNSTLQIQKENNEKAMATSGPGLDGIKPSELGKEKKKTEIKIDNFRPTCLRIQAKVEEQKETAEKLESDLEKTKYKLNNLETNVELLQRRYKQLPATLTNVKEFNTKVPDLKRGDKVTNIPIASNCSIPKESAQKYSQRSSALSSTLLPKTSTTYSLDAILKEKWKKYFPSGISPLNAYAQKSGNEFGYVSAEEQVAMRQRARVTEKYTDPRSITSIIEDNKRWLRKF